MRRLLSLLGLISSAELDDHFPRHDVFATADGYQFETQDGYLLGVHV